MIYARPTPLSTFRTRALSLSALDRWISANSLTLSAGHAVAAFWPPASSIDVRSSYLGLVSRKTRLREAAPVCGRALEIVARVTPFLQVRARALSLSKCTNIFQTLGRRSPRDTREHTTKRRPWASTLSVSIFGDFYVWGRSRVVETGAFEALVTLEKVFSRKPPVRRARVRWNCPQSKYRDSVNVPRRFESSAHVETLIGLQAAVRGREDERGRREWPASSQSRRRHPRIHIQRLSHNISFFLFFFSPT